MPTTKQSPRHRWQQAVIALLVCHLPGILGGLATAPTVRSLWYQSLHKPSFQPPATWFAPVWLLLYTLMGLSLFLSWPRPEHPVSRKNVRWFALQLLLNTLWSPAFFLLHCPRVALLILLLLLLSASRWVFLLYRSKARAAALLQIPYLLWLCFATLLNATIVILNP